MWFSSHRCNRRHRKRKGSSQKRRRCHRLGHQSKDCYAKTTQGSKAIDRISVADSDVQGAERISVLIDGKEIQALVDTGTAVNCIQAAIAPTERYAFFAKPHCRRKLKVSGISSLTSAYP
ncbi:hypothetical protein K470DRAFT_26154 [Piedraia hortae CBS 480.64]|uniref:Uncharacterized protein n=1 Tax=Piedraia hortae CBS 480.64 TaxID=1314780 RepID=A0A6A7C2Z4_9PEZI|nr:hypothetical protein K470DRAFT_26154 [Piedraia hortae CBS 480.64]